MTGRTSIEILPDTWRRQAKTLRQYGGETPAMALEACAVQLEAVLRKRDETTLTLTDAARESGYSTDHLSRDGKIPNAGRPGAPGSP